MNYLSMSPFRINMVRVKCECKEAGVRCTRCRMCLEHCKCTSNIAYVNKTEGKE